MNFVEGDFRRHHSFWKASGLCHLTRECDERQETQNEEGDLRSQLHESERLNVPLLIKHPAPKGVAAIADQPGRQSSQATSERGIAAAP